MGHRIKIRMKIMIRVYLGKFFAHARIFGLTYAAEPRAAGIPR